jgi:hypothetical protein
VKKQTEETSTPHRCLCVCYCLLLFDAARARCFTHRTRPWPRIMSSAQLPHYARSLSNDHCCSRIIRPYTVRTLRADRLCATRPRLPRAAASPFSRHERKTETGIVRSFPHFPVVILFFKMTKSGMAYVRVPSPTGESTQIIGMRGRGPSLVSAAAACGSRGGVREAESRWN